MGHHPMLMASPAAATSGVTLMTWILIGMGATIVVGILYYIYTLRKGQ